MKKAKNIHLSEECVKFLSIQAIENGMVFKTYVESLLEAMVKKKKKK